MENQSVTTFQNSQQTIPTQGNSKLNYWKIFTLIFATLFIGTASIYVLGLQKEKELSKTFVGKQEPTNEKTEIGFPSVTPSNVDFTATAINSEWEKTDIAGGGVSFKYPKSWHVVSNSQVEGKSLGYRLVLINPKPFNVATTHGPDSDFWISVQNGLANPEEEFNKQLSDERKNLVEIKEEMLSSKYFDKIYHITGKIAGGGMMGGTEVEKYFFILTNQKYFPSEKQNINIFSAGVTEWTNDKKQTDILKQIVLSVKECHYTWCENE